MPVVYCTFCGSDHNEVVAHLDHFDAIFKCKMCGCVHIQYGSVHKTILEGTTPNDTIPTFDEAVEQAKKRAHAINELKEWANGVSAAAKGSSFSMDKNSNQDDVNHPKHYANGMTVEVECIMFTRNMSFDIGNAFKYIWRAGNKDDLKQDLEKALWYLRDAMHYGETCNFRQFRPFLPVNHLPTWKYEGLLHIIHGNIKLAIHHIDAILDEAVNSEHSDGSRLIDSPSADERVQGG